MSFWFLYCFIQIDVFHVASHADNEAAAGRDGFRPIELKALPLYAWTQRQRVLALAHDIGKWPSDYYEVASPALRKMDKLDPSAHRSPPYPKDHRLLSIYTQLYRIESGAWYHNHKDWMAKVMHKNCGGAMPGRECLEVSWDTQAELACAIEQLEEAVLAFLDYSIFSTLSSRTSPANC